MHSAAQAMGLEEKHWVDKECDNLCPKLSMKQRLIGYCCCFAFGSLLNIFSWTSLMQLIHGKPEQFVILFVLGNVIQLLGSMFLSGPIAYGKKLIGPTMRLAAFLYFSSMISLIIVCFIKTIKDNGERLGLVIMMIVIIYVCMLYFFICSIPFGKRMVDSCIKSICVEKYENCQKAMGCQKKPESTTERIFGGSSSSNKSKGKESGGSVGSFFSSLASSEQKSEEPAPAKKSWFGV